MNFKKVILSMAMVTALQGALYAEEMNQPTEQGLSSPSPKSSRIRAGLGNLGNIVAGWGALGLTMDSVSKIQGVDVVRYIGRELGTRRGSRRIKIPALASTNSLRCH